MRTTFRTLAAAAAVALLTAACGAAPDDEAEEPTETEDTTSEDEGTEDEGTDEETEDEGTEEASDLRACQVTDTGGVDDRSFNQTAYAGLERAEEELGAEIAFLESQTESDFGPNISQFVQDDCDIIVTVGFLLDAATQTAAQENPDQDFAIIDVDFFDFDAGEDITYDNVRELTFATDQAAFLAGYLAADTSESGIVGTYGGINIPSVTIFMDGMLAGVNYYNEQNGTDVQLLGWDGAEGSFTGNFESQDDGRNLTDSLLQQGADIIMPVAGPVGLGTVAAVEDANAGGASAQVIWVDTDGTVAVPQSADVFLTSVLKRMDNAVFDTVETKANDAFEGGLYVGTLENEGVGIVTEGLEGDIAGELDALREQIIAGELATTPAG